MKCKVPGTAPLTRRAYLGGAIATALFFMKRPGFATDSTVATANRWFLEPLDRMMLDWIHPNVSDRILDAGCGPGDHAILFAELASGGTITALDLAPARIKKLTERLQGLEVAPRIRPVVADVLQLPMPDSSFDVVWSSHTMHILADPVLGVCELTRVCRRGGRVIIREDRFLERLLPMDVGIGQPGLEERARTHFVNWFTKDRMQRGRVPYGWHEVLERAGLANVTTKSFLFEKFPPFSASEIEYLRDRKIARHIHDETNQEDREVIRQLCDPTSPHYFVRKNLHYTDVSTLYIGTK